MRLPELFDVDVEAEPEVIDWLESLPRGQLQRVEWHVELLAAHGPILGMPYVKHLGDGLRELRFPLHPNEMRITFWVRSQTVVLLTVFRKTRMNEQQQVARAKELLKVCKLGDPAHTAQHEYDTGFDPETADIGDGSGRTTTKG